MLELIFFLSLTSVIGFLVDPTEIVQALDNKYAKLLNEFDYQGIVSQFYHEVALVVPPKPTGFVKKPGLPHLFPLMQEYWGDNMEMTPEIVKMEEENGKIVIHEIGSYKGVYNRYYQRWMVDNGSWWITFHAMGIGSPKPGANTPFSGSFNATLTHGDSTKIIAELEQEFDDLYNVQDFAGVAALFHEDALLVPRSPDRYFVRSELTNYFQSAYLLAGLMHCETKPVIVIQESPTVIHELSGIRVNNETEFLPFYVRWTKSCLGWKMKFYLSVFAVRHPHPPLKKL